MAVKVIQSGLNKVFAPVRNVKTGKINSYIGLRAGARVNPKYLKNIPDSTPENSIYLSRKIIHSEKGGAYTEEVIYPSHFRQINYYNGENNKIKSTDIRLSAGFKKTTSRIYDKSGKVIRIETENLSLASGRKNIQTCDIDPETGKLIRYEMFSSNGKTFAKFERDKDGAISRYTDCDGNEFLWDMKTYKSQMKYKATGKTERVNYPDTAGKFYSYIRPQIHIDIKKYL